MKIKYVLPLLILLVGLVACDNEIDITDEWQDTTVIYGLLDPEADTNFVLIQRGYLGNGPAAASFNEPDSFYYNTLDVKLNWYNTTSNELVGSTDLIVDFTSRKLNDNGPFGIQDAHRVYRVPVGTLISPDFVYEIVVTKPNGEITSARTSIVQDYFITAPIPSLQPPKYTREVKFKNRAENISFYQVYMHFNYREYNLVTKAEEPKTVSIPFGELTQKVAGDYELDMPLQTFFDRIAARITDDGNQDIVRIFDDLKLEIYGADENLYTYMNLNTPATGINQNRPDFTNVTNGIGLFASRSLKVLEGIDLNDRGTPQSAKDFLLFNENMCPLRFVRFEGPDTCICNDPVTLNKICL